MKKRWSISRSVGASRTPSPASDSESTISAIVASAMLFAFPLFIVSVRHWASSIYILVCLIALPSLRRGWRGLGREDRMFVGVILAYLISTIASNTMSGWTYASVRWYQADMRFLFAIPLYLFLRLNPNVAVGLLRALPFAGVYIGIQAVYDTFIGTGRVDGPYGPIFFGDIAALTTVLALASIRYDTYPIRIRIPLHVFGTVMGLVAVVLSGTRNAWFATVLALPLAVAFALTGFRRGRKRFLAVLVGLAFAVVALGVTEAPYLTKIRFNSAIGELTAYYQITNQEERNRIASTSVGFRLEQWRVGLDIFTERPLLGYGVGNVGKEVNRHVEAGRASHVLYSEAAEGGRPTHLHSAYLDALTHKGLIGLLALLAVLSYPAYLAIRLREQAPNTFGILVVHAVAFGTFSLTEDPFIRNNFSSVFLIFTTSFLTLLSKEAGGRTARRSPVAIQPDVREVGEKTAVICLSPGKGGMELDAVRTARMLSASTKVVLLIKRGGHLDHIREMLLSGYDIAVETVSFRFNYSLPMVVATRAALRRHRVANVIYFGSSELKSLCLAFLGLGLNVIMRHGTTKGRPKKDMFHRLIYKCVHWHVAISAHLAGNVEALYPLRSRSCVIQIYPSIAAPPVSDFRRPGSTVQIIHVGRICRGKGQDQAIRACAQLAGTGVDFELMLVGDAGGPEADDLTALIENLGLAGKVHFTGHVDNVYLHLLSADVFLFPSAGEGFGNALAEALCTGLVPVVFDNTATAEIMRLGFYGHLIPDRDEQALATVLQRVCAHISDEKRRAYANIARARELFSEERERREYLQLIVRRSPR